MEVPRGVTSILELIPINSHVDEAEDVAAQHRQHGQQRIEVGTVPHLEFEHHDGDDDRDDAIAEEYATDRFRPSGDPSPVGSVSILYAGDGEEPTSIRARLYQPLHRSAPEPPHFPQKAGGSIPARSAPKPVNSKVFMQFNDSHLRGDGVPPIR